MTGLYQLIFESNPSGILVADENGQILTANPQVAEIFGYAREQLIGRPVEVLMPLRFRKRHRLLRANFVRSQSKQMLGTAKEFIGLSRDGREFPVEIGLNCVRDTVGSIVIASVVAISQRKQLQDHREFLARELKHRMQNLFSVVETLAARTFTADRALQQAKAVFFDRIRALSNSYAALADSEYQRAPLTDVIRRGTEPFSDRITITGCDFDVSANAAQQFGLIVHELATNSLKYGALSSPDGYVSIEATVKDQNGDRLFSFQWVESGGPLVFKPEREGFGTTLLLVSCGHAKLDYHKEGLRYSLDVPVEAIAASRTPQV